MSDVDEYLSARGIAPDVAAAADLFDVPRASEIYGDFRSAPALVIPYLTIQGEPVSFERDGAEHAFCRVRYMGELAAQRGRKKPMRYTQPSDSGCRAYFAPADWWPEVAADPGIPVMITEGEIKALSVCAHVMPCIGLGGVSSTVRDGQFLPELSEFVWDGREVYVCFDSDAADNPKVTAAEARLVEELQTKRGARCRLMRVPAGEAGAKMGIDDYLVAYGANAVQALVDDAQDLYALDAKVIALNRSCAWIEQEGMIYDLETRAWISKDNFTTGGRFSSLKHFQPAKKGGDVKTVQVAKTWLTHAHAQRFASAIFRPGEGDVVMNDGGHTSLNLWTGWDEREGDVSPFLELNDFLFQRMEAKDRDLALKLFAYKFQNPQEKIPLALVMIGPQGCGKSMWARCIREACGPHGVPLPSSALHADFNDWQEGSLVVTIDEAEESDMQKGRDVLKSMISEQKRNMNAKYRPARTITTYYQVIITSNNRAAGAFSADDRRMIVADCPPKREAAFYERIGAWLAGGGARCLAHYLLNYPLGGWTPPKHAPMSAEKHMAYVEGLTPVQRFAEDCNTADENRVKQWLDSAAAWGDVSVSSNNPQTAAIARKVLDSLPAWQVRAIYTPDELAVMLPMLADQSGAGRVGKRTTAGEISRQLRDAGIRYLQNSDDPRGFRWQGKVQQFLVIADMAEWPDALSQSEFDRYMASAPRYSQIRGRRAG